jgi:Uma2 family endonuclease
MGTVTVLPRGRALTHRDLEQMPDDGRRHAPVDGTLIVTPAPSWRHQRASARLHLLLAARCPPDLELLYAPFDIALDDVTVLQPDLLVARKSDFTERDLPVAPLLAVEILSPSTRRVDLTLKRSRFEAAGCPSYWVVDPDEPSIVVWQLHGEEYVEVARAAGTEQVDVDAPYPLHLRPADLLD